MTRQPSLFDDPPLPAHCDHKRARDSDPASSREAAESIRSKADAQARRVAEFVRKWPGRTSLELAALVAAQAPEYDRYVLARRLPEAERDGTVKRGNPKLCDVSRHKALTWWPRDPWDDVH